VGIKFNIVGVEDVLRHGFTRISRFLVVSCIPLWMLEWQGIDGYFEGIGIMQGIKNRFYGAPEGLGWHLAFDFIAGTFWVIYSGRPADIGRVLSSGFHGSAMTALPARKL